MPKAKIGKNGVVEIDGKPLEVDGETVEIQSAVDDAVKSRLKNERDAHKTAVGLLNEKMSTLEKDSAEYKTLQIQHDNLKAQMEKAEDTAKERVQTQMKTLEDEKKAALEAASTATNQLLTERVTNSIMTKATKFLHVDDVVSRLLPVLRSEDEVGKDGNKTGKQVHTYKMKFKDEKGVEKEDFVVLDRALEIVGTERPNWVKGTGTGGPSGDINPKIPEGSSSVTATQLYPSMK